MKILIKLKQSLINDYILICFLLGNDFLPHFPSVNIRTNGMDILLNIYEKVNKNLDSFLIKDNKINWKVFRKFITFLADNEDYLIQEEYKLRNKMQNKKYNNLTDEERFQNIPIMERDTELFINPFEDEWEYRYYKILFDLEISEERRKQICTNYLSMLEWTYKYYNEDCKEWRFKYNYNYPPLFKDLLIYVPYFDTKFLEENANNPVNNIIQLAYVLPRNNLNLLPKNVSDKLLNNLQNHYKLDYRFEWAYCRYFWESHVKMPVLSIEELEKLLK